MEARVQDLTERELEYIVLVCRYPKPTELQIAEYMQLSRKTVQKHCAKAFEKLGVHWHSDMDHKAVELGLVKCMCQRMKDADKKTNRPQTP